MTSSPGASPVVVGSEETATDLGKTKNDQQQEPKPKRASRARKATAVADSEVVIRDPSLYAEMSRPYATREEANAALSAFLRDVRVLRAKHRIGDVVTVACAAAVDSGPVITWGQNGDAFMATPMLAYALGAAEAEDKARVDRMRERGAAGGK